MMSYQEIMTSRWVAAHGAPGLIQWSQPQPRGWAVITESGVYIADYMCEDVAKHIAAMHNTWLDDLGELVRYVGETA